MEYNGEHDEQLKLLMHVEQLTKQFWQIFMFGATNEFVGHVDTQFPL